MDGFDIQAIGVSLPFLFQGFGLSLFLTVIAMIGRILFGLVLALVRLSRYRFAGVIAAAYVNGFRAVPLILVIFWFYFLVPLLLGYSVGALYSAIIAFVMFEAAYYSEIIRAGIRASPGDSGTPLPHPECHRRRRFALSSCLKRSATCSRSWSPKPSSFSRTQPSSTSSRLATS